MSLRLVCRVLCLLFSSALAINQTFAAAAHQSMAATVTTPDGSETERMYTFDPPIDAISFSVPSAKFSEQEVIDLRVSTLLKQQWSPWEALLIEKEFDPLLTETNLIMLPRATRQVKVRGTVPSYTVHPIRIATDPAWYEVAATLPVQKPRILSRKEWGADETLLIAGAPSTRPEEQSEIGKDQSSEVTTLPQRVQQCRQDQLQYPAEFQTSKSVKADRSGQAYRWPQSYSNAVTMLVVHHTALAITGDPRPPVERMRALYQYHAQNRGWGDIGYHYVIDESGQVYEGRAGGDYVVGGHAYCHNVGTIGIALMGNFESEEPTQLQMQSLQWLSYFLSRKYRISLSQDTVYHGQTRPTIVGHGDLVSTTCPGFFVRSTLPQVLRSVQQGITDARIYFPPKPGTPAPAPERPIASAGEKNTAVQAIGSVEISGKPLQQFALQVLYRTPAGGKRQRSRLAQVERSDPRIDLWQEWEEGSFIRVRNELLAAQELSSGQTKILRLRIDLPEAEGNYTLTIGDIHYALTAAGRPIRRSLPSDLKGKTTPQNIPAQFPASPSPRTIQPIRQTSRHSVTLSNRPIRIRLSLQDQTMQLTSSSNLTVADRTFSEQNVSLSKNGNECTATIRGRTITQATVRFSAQNGIIQASAGGLKRRYRGIIECRIIEDEIVLINELPLEDYLAGLAEEPDGEPYEKQRAFAIAARTYAAHYLQPQWRKFGLQPYDGDDSPARFQKYVGYDAEEQNPRWVQAVHSTTGLVLTKDHQIIRAAYFSADDGTTRSPAQAGWPNFPHAAVFAAKPDPWCKGLERRGHGVGMSGCGAEGQANEGKKAEEILQYYYTGVLLETLLPGRVSPE